MQVAVWKKQGELQVLCLETGGQYDVLVANILAESGLALLEDAEKPWVPTNAQELCGNFYRKYQELRKEFDMASTRGLVMSFINECNLYENPRFEYFEFSSLRY
jgi:ribosomal protein L11 methylase PrmA